MCGQANCVPFGCVVGEAIEHLGAGNIIAGLVVVFSMGLALGYLTAMKRTKLLAVRPADQGQHIPPENIDP